MVRRATRLGRRVPKRSNSPDGCFADWNLPLREQLRGLVQLDLHQAITPTLHAIEHKRDGVKSAPERDLSVIGIFRELRSQLADCDAVSFVHRSGLLFSVGRVAPPS